MITLVLAIVMAFCVVGFLEASFDLASWNYQQKMIRQRQQKYTKFTGEPYQHEED